MPVTSVLSTTPTEDGVKLVYISLREVLVVNFTFCGDFCGDFHYKSKSPQVLVAVFTTGLNHHKFLW